MSDNGDDKLTGEVKPGDQRISALYRQGRDVEPPAAVDERILAASCRAVGTRPRALGPFSSRWPIPVSVAAVLLIAIAVVPLMTRETQQDIGSTVGGSRQEAAPQMEAPAREPAAGRSDAPALQERRTNGLSHKQRLAEPVAPASEPASEETTPRAAREAAESTLARIAKLIDEGRLEQARREMRAFRQAYPSHPVDDALLRRLGMARESVPE